MILLIFIILDIAFNYERKCKKSEKHQVSSLLSLVELAPGGRSVGFKQCESGLSHFFTLAHLVLVNSLQLLIGVINLGKKVEFATTLCV